jgi:hypothetical protein
LFPLKQRYPQLRLKLAMPTRTLLMCDRTWMLLGGPTLLGAPESRPIEVGLYTTDPNTIFSWVNRIKL